MISYKDIADQLQRYCSSDIFLQ